MISSLWPRCPTPTPTSPSVGSPQPPQTHNGGSRCPVPTLMSPFNAAQNLLQIKWIKKDLKVAPTSSVGGWDGIC